MNNDYLYTSMSEQFDINMNTIKTSIKGNEMAKLYTMITEIRNKRIEVLKEFSKDTSIQNRYNGNILSVNGSIWNDFDKSIEYEAILLSISNLLNEKSSNKVEIDKDEQIDHLNICSICLTNIISYCCNPCGHTYCSGCIFKTENCYICRSAIISKIKIFI